MKEEEEDDLMNGDGEFMERGALSTTLKVKDERDLSLINDSAAE